MIPPTTHLKLGVAIVFVTLGPSCDGRKSGLVDDTHPGRPLATIRGSISIAAPDQITSPISIAVAWSSAEDIDEDNPENFDYEEYIDDYNDMCPPPIWNYRDSGLPEDCDGTIGPPSEERCRTVNEHLWSMHASAYQAESLLEFTLPIYELPPKQARTDLTLVGGSGWYAEGLVVAFTDRNGNGRFDRSSPDNVRDRVISASYSESKTAYYFGMVIYLDGAFPPESDEYSWFDVPIEKGINLIVEDDETEHRLAPDERLVLTPVEAGDTGAAFVNLQCAEAEYHIEHNVPAPKDGVTDCGIMQTMVDKTAASCDGDPCAEDAGDDHADAGEDIFEIEFSQYDWYVEYVKSDNPCIVYIKDTAICVVGDAPPPDAWLEQCGGTSDAVLTSTVGGD